MYEIYQVNYVFYQYTRYLCLIDQGEFICLYLSLTTLNSEEFTLSSVRFQVARGLSAFGFYIFIYALVFPYISLLVDCFKWAIIGNIEQQTVHSVLWQFQWEGGPSAFGIYMFSVCTDISLYFLISCPFQIGSNWQH